MCMHLSVRTFIAITVWLWRLSNTALSSNSLCLQSGYDSRDTGNYRAIYPTNRGIWTNAGRLGRWAFHVNNFVTGNHGVIVRS